MCDLFFIMSNEDESSVADVVNQTAQALHRLGKDTMIVEIAQSVPFLTLIKNIFSKKKHTFGIYQQNGIYHSIFVSFPFLSRWQIGQSLTLMLHVLYLQWWAFLHFRYARKIFWFPYPYRLWYIPSSFIVLYDMFDFITSRNKYDANSIERRKKILLRRADVIVSISLALKKMYQSDAKHTIHIVPQGFATPQNSKNRKITINRSIFLKKPIIGYVGSINERMDFDLIHTLVKKHPEWTFVFVGPIGHEYSVSEKNVEKRFSEITSYPHVIHVDRQSRIDLYGYLKEFTIAMIPYDVAEKFNAYCYPMKLFEYFYFGKPVIATPIKELFRFSRYVKIGRNEKEWEKQIFLLLKKPWKSSYQREERQLAQINTWDQKIKSILNILKE